MAKQIQLRRGTTAEHGSFTGAVGEVTVDTTKDTVVVHDGTTVGGFPLAKESDVAGKQDAGTYNTVIGTDSDINTSGATIIDNLYMTDGVITSHGTRNLTLADLGYTGETNATADMTASEILTAIKTVDGANSGLDADLLDGKHGSEFATLSGLATVATTGSYNDLTDLPSGQAQRYTMLYSGTFNNASQFVLAPTTQQLSDYSHFYVEFVGMNTSTNSSHLRFRMSNDGGATYPSGGSDYMLNRDLTNSGTDNTTDNVRATGNPLGVLSQNILEQGANGWFRFYPPVSKAPYACVDGYLNYIDSGTGCSNNIFLGRARFTGATVLKMYFDVGTILNGDYRVYGVK